MKNFRVIVAGGRDFDQYKLLAAKLDHYLADIPKNEIEIVEGGALGADRLARRYAEENGLKTTPFEADWQNLTAPGAIVKRDVRGREYNAKAGNDRNMAMATYVLLNSPRCGLVAFWDGSSTGTGDMIKIARKLNIETKVVRYG